MQAERPLQPKPRKKREKAEPGANKVTKQRKAAGQWMGKKGAEALEGALQEALEPAPQAQLDTPVDSALEAATRLEKFLAGVTGSTPFTGVLDWTHWDFQEPGLEPRQTTVVRCEGGVWDGANVDFFLFHHRSFTYLYMRIQAAVLQNAFMCR